MRTPLSVLAIEDTVRLLSEDPAMTFQHFGQPGRYDSLFHHRLFDLDVVVQPEGPIFINVRRGDVLPVPSLVLGGEVHVFRDTCYEVIRQLEAQSLLVGYDLSDVIARVGADLFLILRPGSAVDIPAPEDGGYWYFEYAQLVDEVPARLVDSLPPEVYPPRVRA